MPNRPTSLREAQRTLRLRRQTGTSAVKTHSGAPRAISASSAKRCRRWCCALALACLLCVDLSIYPTVNVLSAGVSFAALPGVHAQARDGGGADSGAEREATTGAQSDTPIEFMSPEQETAAIASGWPKFAPLEQDRGDPKTFKPNFAADARGARTLSANEEAAAIVRGWSNAQ